MRIAVAGNFALEGNQTMAVRALPLAHQLADLGHEVRVAMPARLPADKSLVETSGRVTVRVFSARLPRGPQCFVVQLLQMIWWLARWRPSAVYCFKPIAFSGVVLAAFRVLRAVGLYRGRIVLDTDDWEGEGGWNEKHRVPVAVKKLIARQEAWSLRHADAVTVASRELGVLAKEIGARMIVYLPNCLDRASPLLEPGAPGRLRARIGCGQAPLVLVYTRFVEYSLARLVDVFRAILRQEPSAQFVVVGTGLNGEERTLEALLRSEGIGDRFHLHGWASPGDLREAFGDADVAIYLMDDNLLNRTKCPMKLVELTSAGVPVVADRVGQASEYLVDAETGVLVPPGDSEAMASAVAGLLRSPGARMAMSALAKKTAECRYRWPSWAPSVEKILLGG